MLGRKTFVAGSGWRYCPDANIGAYGNAPVSLPTPPPTVLLDNYSTVTDFARLRGLSGLCPSATLV